MAAPLTLYSAWFCPYAQRAWLALLHRGVPFVRVESLSHPDGPAAPYTKLPALLAANPRGLVPTLVDGGGRVCGESLVVLELVSEAGNITPASSYDTVSGRLTMTGAGSIAEYQKLLRAVKAIEFRYMAGSG